jgi:O-antigen/teichoic acid export membrane protein
MLNRRQIIKNTTFSFILNLSLRAAGTLTFIAIGRLSQPADAGTFSLALGYLAILNTLFLGLDDVLVRECTRMPHRIAELAVTYGVLRVVASLTAWLALLIVLAVLGLYSTGEWIALAVITSSILFDTFSSIGQSILYSRDSFGWPLVATAVTSFVRVGGALLALLAQRGLLAVALAWPIGSAVGVFVIIIPLTPVLRELGGWRVFRFDRPLARQLWRTIRGFSVVSILAGLEYQLDVILLSILLSRTDVAWYSAAVTIMLIVLLISQAYRMVLYPTLVRALHESPAAARRLIKRSVLVMAGLALPLAGLISLAAPYIIQVLYGDKFSAAIPILQVLIWNTVFFFLNVPLVRFMLASDGQSTVWQTLLLSLSVNVLVNLLLIPQVGAMGAAYARLCSSGLFCAVMGWHVTQRLRNGAVGSINQVGGDL